MRLMRLMEKNNKHINPQPTTYNPQPIVVSTPGKVHLLGEHAVVYGHPALLATIDKRLYITVKSQKLKVKSQNGEEIAINTTVGGYLVKQAVDVFKRAFSVKKLPPLEITVTSDIPTGSGLGSSAALAAATIGALMKLVKNIWNPVRMNELAFEVEKLAHGNPSGADNTTVVFGGLVWFRREFDFLKSIWQLPISSYKIPKFILIDTGKPIETTKEMVEGVAKLYKKNGKLMKEVFNNQEALTKRLLMSLRNDDKKVLIQTIGQGERNLEKMGVVGDFAKKLIREIENIGVANIRWRRDKT